MPSYTLDVTYIRLRVGLFAATLRDRLPPVTCCRDERSSASIEIIPQISEILLQPQTHSMEPKLISSLCNSDIGSRAAPLLRLKDGCVFGSLRGTKRVTSVY